MTYYVAVENGEKGSYTAQVLGWPDTIVQGISRQDVLKRVQERLEVRLQRVELVPINVEPSPQQEHPWLKFAGMFENEPIFDRVLEHIEDDRRALDEKESIP